ncbi:hypothetical protein bcgnr5390_06080 [Bacillus luti]
MEVQVARRLKNTNLLIYSDNNSFRSNRGKVDYNSIKQILWYTSARGWLLLIVAVLCSQNTRGLFLNFGFERKLDCFFSE